MSKGVAFVFFALLCASTPLSAQLSTLTINGTVTGTQSTVFCDSGSAPDCLTTYPGGMLSEQFLAAFDFPLVTTNLVQGDNPFTLGHPRASGFWSGTITNSNGYLTGQNLSFLRESSSCQFGAIGCQVVVASAATFNVVGGIPEPGTWATMLLGFFLLGSAMRTKLTRSARLQAGSSQSQ